MDSLDTGFSNKGMANLEFDSSDNIMEHSTSVMHSADCTNPFSPFYRQGPNNDFLSSTQINKDNFNIDNHTERISTDFQTSNFSKESFFSKPSGQNQCGTSVDSIQCITNASTEALKVVVQGARTPKLVLPYVFHGLVHEDPIKFIEQLQHYFLNDNILFDTARVELAISRLDGEALRWVEPYRHLNLTYNVFVERFLNKFNSSQVISEAMAKLYGESQGLEQAEVFITKKSALFSRLLPNSPEIHKVSTILNLLKPEIRANLRGPIVFSNVEELLRVASQIEGDLSKFKPYVAPPLRNNQSRNQGENDRSNGGDGRNNRPSYPCRYCNEMHFHRDCPQNPYLSENK